MKVNFYLITLHGHNIRVRDFSSSKKPIIGFISTVLTAGKSVDIAVKKSKALVKKRWESEFYKETESDSLILDFDDCKVISFGNFLFNRIFNFPLIRPLVATTPHCNFIFYHDD